MPLGYLFVMECSIILILSFVERIFAVPIGYGFVKWVYVENESRAALCRTASSDLSLFIEFYNSTAVQSAGIIIRFLFLPIQQR